jgi:hypothetical protein
MPISVSHSVIIIGDRNYTNILGGQALLNKAQLFMQLQAELIMKRIHVVAITQHNRVRALV